MLGINLSSDDFSVQVPQREVPDLQNDQKAILCLWLLVVCIVLISMYICCNVLNFSINVFDERVVHILLKRQKKSCFLIKENVYVVKLVGVWVFFLWCKTMCKYILLN